MELRQKTPRRWIATSVELVVSLLTVAVVTTMVGSIDTIATYLF